MYNLWALELWPSNSCHPSLLVTHVLDCSSAVNSKCRWSLLHSPLPLHADYADINFQQPGFLGGVLDAVLTYCWTSLPASAESCCQRMDAQSTSSPTWGEQMGPVLLSSLGSAMEIGHRNPSLPVTYTPWESSRNLWVGAICQLNICFFIEVWISDRAGCIKYEP